MSWRVGTVCAARAETATARTLGLDVPGWPGHLAGQHVDVRLTAPDGYSATRSYSIASAPDADRVEITVQQVPDGEVSPYLVGAVVVGEQLELRGPVGGWFVWRPEQAGPVQLVAGGSGVVPVMAMARANAAAGSPVPMRLLYSVRDPGALLYRDDILAAGGLPGVGVVVLHTRSAPPGETTRRIDAGVLATSVWAPADAPTTYVCGPTGFVEHVSELLLAAGHDPASIRTERFGPSGGPR